MLNLLIGGKFGTGDIKIKQLPLLANGCNIGVTFSDVLCAVRIEILAKAELSISHFRPDIDSFSHRIRHLWFLLAQTAD